MAQVLGAFLIFTLIPLLGALPLTGWIVRLLTNKNLKKIGTGNTSVSAAFYHGGTPVGLAAVAAEAFKGISAVLLARYFFGPDPIWPVLSLIFLVMGRYWGSQGAGTTNIAWGFFVYDPIVAAFTLLISGIAFTLLRLRSQGRLFVLVLMPVLTLLFHPADGMRALVVACLSGLVAWIYAKIPDDLDLSPAESTGDARRMFRFFQGDRALPSLSQVLDPAKVGAKAATLSQLTAWGYPVPPGYILPAGDDPTALIATVFPGIANPADSVTHDQRVVARSSAVGEDGLTSSAAGQYVSITDITSPAALERAITVCLNAYNAPSALRYRESRGLPEGKMNVLVQPHIAGVFSGVAFSRDPVARAGDAVTVEALPGDASKVVSGKLTPERYQVFISERPTDDWQLSADANLSVESKGPTTGRIPQDLIQQVAYLARHIEEKFHGIPQDIEWTFDGEKLWLLQSRPITTLLPIWTRKIAAEVIPGVIRPLTWSINRPLTCGVWGDLFTLVLKGRAAGMDFSQTATLHYARAYFNATLLGDLFTRMGLPAESLEFLTRGAKFSRPPLIVTLRNLPGLLRLVRRDMALPRQFAQADKAVFRPAQTVWANEPVSGLSEEAITQRIEQILSLLEQATYYNILAPLGFALRQAVLKVDLATLDNRTSPEVMALEDLKAIANSFRPIVPELTIQPREDASKDVSSTEAVFCALAEHPEGRRIFEQVGQFLSQYGYLSEVATDIAVPTWQESPQTVRDLLAQYLLDAAGQDSAVQDGADKKSVDKESTKTWKTRQAQARLNLKGRVAEVYNRLLSELRACFVALETYWLAADQLEHPGDIFFLTQEDIFAQIFDQPVAQLAGTNGDLRLSPGLSTGRLPKAELKEKVSSAKTIWQQQGSYRVPTLVYGESVAVAAPAETSITLLSSGTLRGIGASGGNAEGIIQVLRTLPTSPIDIGKQTILVVPYTDAGWSPLLSRIGGLIAEVGGQLSHGAIIAREYGIPAVMDVTDATHRLTTGQRVRIDGQNGTIEVL